MNPSILQSSFLFFKIFLIIYNINPSSSSPHHDPRYENCISNSTSCGTSLGIAYPFWGNGCAQYCGHPGFELYCDKSNLTITILSNQYNVIDINYSTSVLRIAREEFSQGACPGFGDLRNTTLDLTLFNYTSEVRKAILFYNCSANKTDTKAPFSFSCPEGNYPSSLSYFVFTKDWEHDLDKICGVKVYVPVYTDAIQDLIDDPSNVGVVLKRGFEVNWVIDEGHCHQCSVSGGRCGYNTTLGQSTCFCEKGAYSTICPASTSSKDLSTKAKVGIGLGAAVAGLVIMITCIVFLLPPKEHHPSSTLPTQTSSHHPSTVNVEEKNTYFGAHLFTYDELEQATNNFEPSRELGRGGFGIVYHGKLQDGHDVAIKRLYEKHTKQVAQFMNELEILTSLDHKHLVKLNGCTTRHSRDLLLVYEYVPNGTVAEHLHGKRAKPGSLPWSIRLRIAIETASALVYLHSSDIIHRDVKTKNILLDVNYSVKVVDFGLSRLFPLDVTHVSTTPQGSPGYVDPEYHQCYQLTNKSDVYSFGVVLAELISAKPAVDRSRSRDEINLSSMAMNKIQNLALHEFVDSSIGFESNSKVREEVTAMAELTFQCLQATREMRPSVEEVLARLINIPREKSVPNDHASVAINDGDSLTSSFGAEKNNLPSHNISISIASDDNSQFSIVPNVSSEVL